MNKEWFLSVPKIAHFYWGGGKLLYLRFLSIKTFMTLNPDWKVILWRPKVSFTGRSWFTEMHPPKINEAICKDYLSDVLKLGVTETTVDFDELGASRTMAEVHKNDYIRVSALYLYGGLWSDTDIIYFKPVSSLVVNNPENKDKEVFVCIYDYGHSTGFNMAVQKSKFFEFMVNNLNWEYRSNTYQCWGPDMWNKYYRKLESIPNAAEIGMDAVYAHNSDQARELLKESKPRFTENSIGCHWYGGNEIWPDFLNKTHGGEKNLPECLITDLINGV